MNRKFKVWDKKEKQFREDLDNFFIDSDGDLRIFKSGLDESGEYQSEPDMIFANDYSEEKRYEVVWYENPELLGNYKNYKQEPTE